MVKDAVELVFNESPAVLLDIKIKNKKNAEDQNTGGNKEEFYDSHKGLIFFEATKKSVPGSATLNTIVPACCRQV